VLSILFGLYVGTAFTLMTGVGAVASATTLFGGLPASPVPVAVGLAAGLVVLAYPEWYVIDAVAVTLGAVVIPMLGLGFGPLPIVVLLVVWAGYDAYTVYVSGHMEELAEGLGELRLPLLFVVPPSLSYSQVEGLFDVGLDDDDETSESTDEATEDDQGPGVRILGLGDAIIPGMLAVSAGEFLDAPVVVPALDAGLPALGAIAGGFVGMLVLFYLLERVERVHAGLPPLNAGVLSGYLLGAVAAGIPLTTAVGL
jgi:presenilin-like A22 family membrane protease